MDALDRLKRLGIEQLHLVGFPEAGNAVETYTCAASGTPDLDSPHAAGQRLQEAIPEVAAAKAVTTADFVLIDAVALAG